MRRIALTLALLAALLTSGATAITACGQPLTQGAGRVLCCCQTLLGGQCCGYASICSSIVPGCICSLGGTP